MQKSLTEIRKTTITGVVWIFLERWGAQLISFCVSFILARLLLPEDYGKISLCLVFISILNNFISSGMGTALIQKKEADDLDFSSLFYFNILGGLILFFIIQFIANDISVFFNYPELTPVIRLLSVFFIISGLKEIQNSYAFKYRKFRNFFLATLGGTIVAAFLGIFLAYRGYGVWSLVWQLLVNNFVDTIILWFIVRWRPRLIFSVRRLKNLFAFGWKIMTAGLLDNIYQNLRHLVIGKYYSSSELAFYEKGNSLPHLVTYNINNAIDTVLFPTFVLFQEHHDELKKMVRRSIKTSTYLLMPLMAGLAVCAEPLIRLLLTDKWLPCVFFLRIFCITYCFYPIHTANLNAIKALGRSDLFLYLEIAKKFVGLILLVSTMFISVKAMALSLLLSSVLSQLINSWPNRKLLNYSYFDQLLDMLPQIGLSCMMALAVYSVQFLGLNDWLTLGLQIPLGAALYLGGSWLFRLEAFQYLVELAMRTLKARRGSAPSEA